MKSLDEYKIPGTNIVSFSHWSRENIPKPPHAIPIGSVAEVAVNHCLGIERDAVGKEVATEIKGTATLIVVAHHEDCDGTALYWVAAKPFAPPEGSGKIIERMYWESVVGMDFHGISEESLKPTGQILPVRPWPGLAKFFGMEDAK